MSDIAADSPQRSSNRSSNRSGRRRRGGGDSPKKPFLAGQLEWGAVTYLDDPTQPIDPDGVETIHDASMRILEEIGILFLNDEALDILKTEDVLPHGKLDSISVVGVGKPDKDAAEKILQDAIAAELQRQATEEKGKGQRNPLRQWCAI